MHRSYLNPTLVALAASLPLIAGCEDPLKKAQLLEEPRVLGVRANGPTGEADLIPGETSSIEVLLAGPKGPELAQVAYRLCEAEESVQGVPHCARKAFSEGEDSLAEPLSVSVPESVKEDRRVALLGIACTEGDPRLPSDPNDWGCTGTRSALKFSLDLFSRSTTAANRNPDLSEIRVAMAGEALPLEGATVAPSCSDDVPSFARGKKQRLTLTLPSSARESVRADGATRAEALQLSHFSTRGEFERQFSFIDSKSRNLKVQVAWTAPAKAGAVKQYAVVRDERGGLSWSTWTLCVR